MTREELEKLAQSAWEGCHHCDENDRTFWMNGFMIGYLTAQVANIDNQIEIRKNNVADLIIENINK